jgi:hypothetical protein
VAAGWVSVGLIGASAVDASDEPFCNSSYAWARPGIERQYGVWCFNVDRAAVTSVPDHVTLSDFALSGRQVTFRLLPDDAAAPSSYLEFEVSGPGGAARAGAYVNVVPLDQNTAPVCEPESLVQRTSGSGPADLAFPVSCTDAENDDFTIQGGGPGTHSDAPVLVRPSAGDVSPSAWHYRTAASSGTEHSTYWATDQFGAKSDAAAIDLEFGPAADHKPVCTRVPWGAFVADPLTVYLRPGATRLFAVGCTDADGDDFTPQLGTPPSRGTITRFDVTPASVYDAGLSRAIYFEYTPASAFEGEDDFTITTTSDRGSTRTGVALITRTIAQDPGRGGARAADRGVTGGDTVDARAECHSPIGDLLTAAVIGGPEHGQAGAPTSSVLPSGDTKIGVPYTPEPGFSGTDQMTLQVSDGHGDSTTVDVAVDVYGHQELPPIFPPGTTYLDFLGPPSEPPAPSPGAAVGVPFDLARAALGTRDVRAVAKIGAASVFAPRAGLRVVAAQPAIAVACPVECQVGVTSEVLAGKRANRRRHPSRHFTAAPGKAQAVPLHLDRAERSRLRKLRNATAVFRLTVRSGRKTSVARVPLRIHAPK